MDPSTGKDRAGDHVAAATGSALGMVFKPFEHLWRAVPRSVQYFLIGTVVLLVIYPLIVFTAVVFLVQYLPDWARLPLQERAVESWGLARVYSTTSELNLLNEALDTATASQFDADRKRDFDQYVVSGQKVRLAARNASDPLRPDDRACAGAVRPTESTPLGRFAFTIDEIGWRKPASDEGTSGLHFANKPVLSRVLGLEEADWKEIDKIRDRKNTLLLTIAYTPLPLPDTPATALFRRCYRYEVSTYLEVYKPPLVSRVAAAKAAGT